MSTNAAVAPASARVGIRAEGLPWTVLALAVGATSIVIGVIWDISWHSTIGRDTFWTPAHIAIYLGGVVGGMVSGWVVLRTTFGSDQAARDAAVRFWGFRGPLGAWWAIWGAIAMLTSAPFDDWWHNAYGLDVEILSPPHTVLLAGMFGVIIGALILAAASQNRAEAADDVRRVGPSFAGVLAYVAGVALALILIMTTEFRNTNLQHSATFYWVMAALVPLFLFGPSRAVRLRFPATAVAAVYMAVNLAMIWILPLFPAAPLLGPIYNPVTHMVVDVWPLLLVVPAFFVDLLMRWWRGGDRRPGGDWTLALLVGAAFLAIFVAVQWNFSAFLLGEGAKNAFFASDRTWSYGARIGPWMQEFWSTDSDSFHLAAAGIALVLASLSTRLGLMWGGWLSRVQR